MLRRLFDLSLYLSVSVYAVSAMAEGGAIPTDDPTALHLEYKPSEDCLTLHAQNAPMGRVVDALRERALIVVNAADESLLINDNITADVANLSPEKAMRQVFRNFNSVFVAPTDIETGTVGETHYRLKIILLSKKQKNDRDSETYNDKEELTPEASERTSSGSGAQFGGSPTATSAPPSNTKKVYLSGEQTALLHRTGW